MSYIILPEHSIIIPGRDRFRPDKPIAVKNGMDGEYRFILYETDAYRDGSLKPIVETDWIGNIITNNGMNIVHTNNNWNAKITIGSGSTAADVTDTSIETFLGDDDTTGAGNAVVVGQSSPNWEHSETKSKRFNAGTGTGMVSEATLGVSDGGTNIFSRIVLPSPIDKQASHILDVIYRMTIWPFTNDVIGVSTVNGIAYDTITRGMQYGGASVDPFAVIDLNRSSSLNYRAYDGDIGAISSLPSGSFDNHNGSFVLDSYVADSHTVTGTANALLDDWVLGLGIRSLASRTNWYRFQTQYNAQSDGSRITKLSSETATLRFRASWSRT